MTATSTSTPGGSEPAPATAGSRPVRVVQLVTTLARGGAQATVLAALAGHGPGLELTVLAGCDDPGEGTCWAEAQASGARVVPVGPLHRSIRPLADLRALWWLVRWLRRERPDVLHTHSSKAGVLGRVAGALAGVPVVHTVHGWSYAALTGAQGRRGLVLRRAVIALERVLARLSHTLVVVTPLDAEQGLADRIGRPGQYRVIRSGIDLGQPRAGRAERAALRRELGWSDRFVIGSVGRLAPQKELDTLLTAFARADLPGAVLVLVGDGPERDRLAALVAEVGVGDRVRFLGLRSDAARLVAAFDLFVLTSRWEGLPRALVEAVAAGVPVVATGVGGVPEVIRGGVTGTIVPVGDPDALAPVLEAAVADPAALGPMAAAAAELAEGFSVEAMRADLADLWRQAAGVS